MTANCQHLYLVLAGQGISQVQILWPTSEIYTPKIPFIRYLSFGRPMI